jgi:predicted transcriptional regulator
MAQDAYYAAMADKMDRDPLSEDRGRATVPMGLGFKWARFHKGEDTVWVENADGQMVQLTRKQVDLYTLALTFIDNGTTTIRSLARELKCAPSTVSRGLVKLASLGLLAALTGRGRYAGLLIFRLPANGSLDRFRQLAKMKVREWAKAAERRLSRLQSNVASYVLEDRGVDSLYFYVSSISTSKSATLKQEWRSDELVDIV